MSHDRYVIDCLATQVWSLEAGQLHIYNGNYQAYLAASNAERLTAKAQRTTAKQEKHASPKGTRREAASIRALDAEIKVLDNELRVLSTAFEKPRPPLEIQRLGQEYAKTQAQLDELLGRWSRLAETDRASPP